MLESRIFVRFLVRKDKSPKGPAQADSSSEISAEDGLDRPFGQRRVFISNDEFREASCPVGVCFRGVFHRECL